jgi:hypothetical protein
MKILRYRGDLRVRVLEDRGKQSAGRRGHCLMLAWVFLRNVSEMWRIGARHDEGESYQHQEYSTVMVRNAVGGEATVLFIELIIEGYNELTVVGIMSCQRILYSASLLN